MRAVDGGLDLAVADGGGGGGGGLSVISDIDEKSKVPESGYGSGGGYGNPGQSGVVVLWSEPSKLSSYQGSAV